MRQIKKTPERTSRINSFVIQPQPSFYFLRFCLCATFLLLLPESKSVAQAQIMDVAPIEIYFHGRTDPDNNFEDMNPNTRMIGFEIELKPNQREELVVALIPGRADTIKNFMNKPLNDW